MMVVLDVCWIILTLMAVTGVIVALFSFNFFAAAFGSAIVLGCTYVLARR